MPALAASFSTAATKSRLSTCCTNVNTSPDASQPKHLYRPVSSRTLNEAVRSAWNGHRPIQLRPTRFSATYSPTTSDRASVERTRSRSSSTMAMAVPYRAARKPLRGLLGVGPGRRRARREDGLPRRQTGDRHAERAAADVVEAGLVEQRD